MDAFILSAGLGTRLRPLTDRLPKALVPVAGVPMLERVARRLIEAGADRLVVNAHYLAEQVDEFLRAHDGFGVPFHVSHEPGDAPLDTGGGLLHAARFLRGDSPFFMHNCDVHSDIPLGDMYAAHLRDEPLATLAAAERESRSPLLFDDAGLTGIAYRGGSRRLVREPEGRVRELGFCGIHVVSPALIERITERGTFSIVDVYLRLARAGERIVPFRADAYHWIDIGTFEGLEEASRSATPSRSAPG